MSLRVTYGSVLTVEETLESNVPDVAAGNAKITHDQFNGSKTGLTGSSGQAVTVCASFTQALSAGAATIDLTSLTGTNGVTVSGNGLKVKFARFRANTNNANPITLSVGASNGYGLKGSDWTETLAAGQEVLMDLQNAAPTIGSGAKTIDLAGTGTQSVDVQLVMG